MGRNEIDGGPSFVQRNPGERAAKLVTKRDHLGRSPPWRAPLRFLAHGHIGRLLEARIRMQEDELQDAGGAVALLGDDQFGFVALFVGQVGLVEAGAVDEEDQVRVLLSSNRKLHFAGISDHFGCVQNFKAHNAAVIAEVGDHAGAHLVALLDALFPERDGERIGFLVVGDFHGFAPFIYLPILEVM
jgi:hypothetical protein